MSSKDKENKSMQEKLKQFFRLNKGNVGGTRGRGDFTLTEEIERELNRDAPVPTRLKAIKYLSDAVLTTKLEEVSLQRRHV